MTPPAATRGVHDVARLQADAETLKEQAKQRVERGDWGGALFKYTQALGFVDLVEGSGRGDDAGSPPAPADTAAAQATPAPSAAAADADWVRGMRIVLNANAALAAIKTRRWEDAAASCRRVLLVDGTHEKALYRLAVAQHGSGDAPAAVATLHRLLERHPTCDAATKLLRTFTTTSTSSSKPRPPSTTEPLPAVTAAAIAKAFSRQYDPPPVPSTAMPPGTGNASGLLKPLPVDDGDAGGGGSGGLWGAATSWLCCRRCRRGHAGGVAQAGSDSDSGKKFV